MYCVITRAWYHSLSGTIFNHWKKKDHARVKAAVEAHPDGTLEFDTTAGLACKWTWDGMEDENAGERESGDEEDGLSLAGSAITVSHVAMPFIISCVARTLSSISHMEFPRTRVSAGSVSSLRMSLGFFHETRSHGQALRRAIHQAGEGQDGHDGGLSLPSDAPAYGSCDEGRPARDTSPC